LVTFKVCEKVGSRRPHRHIQQIYIIMKFMIPRRHDVKLIQSLLSASTISWRQHANSLSIQFGSSWYLNELIHITRNVTMQNATMNTMHMTPKNVGSTTAKGSHQAILNNWIRNWVRHICILQIQFVVYVLINHISNLTKNITVILRRYPHWIPPKYVK